MGLGRIACGLALLLPLAGRALAQPAPDGGTDDAAQVMLAVDRPLAFTPGMMPVFVNCDDLTIVRVEDAGDHLQLTGLRPGSTLCSFGSLARPGRPLLYRFTVMP